MKADTNNEQTGRPTKYKHEFAKRAYELCLLGVGDAQLAAAFEVAESTINEWKKKFPDFSESVSTGKLIADGQVAAALHKRALGFTYDEVTYEKISLKIDGVEDDSDIKTEAYKKRIVTKMVVPDTGAAMNWLKNRQKELWRDNLEIDFNKLTDSQLDELINRITAKANQNK
jgi:hypothetical protein